MKKIVLVAAILRIMLAIAIISLATAVNGQSVALNTNGASADASAMLDVSSTSKGFLPPRMTTIQRTGISSPANGLLVFDTDTKTFWYFSIAWKEINLNGGGGGSFSLPYVGIYSDPGKIFSINNTDSSNGATSVYGRGGSTGIGITPGINIGVWGDNSRGLGVLGSSVRGVGVYGLSFQNHGVYGYTSDNAYAGVYGSHANNGVGVWGETSSGSGGKGLYGKSTGTSGFAGYFESTNGSNAATTLVAKNSGSGNAIYASSSLGSAGIFAITNSNNTSNVFEAQNNGTNSAGYFSSTNPDNINPAVVIYNGTKGDGLIAHCADLGIQSSAIYAYHDGNGNAMYGRSSLGNSGKFVTDNASNSKATMSIINFGAGQTLELGQLNSASTTPMVQAASEGLGNGVQVHLSNQNSSNAAVYAYTSGNGQAIFARSEKGIAGLFKIENSSNASTALYATTNGTGSGLMVENFNVGVVNSLATFRKSGNNVARIDGTGKGYFNGGTQSSGADVAEAFDVTGNRNEYETGDVLIISIDKDRAVERSSQPYSTLVAGVYATKPGVLLTEENIESDISDKVPMGVVGVIPTKVCLEGGEIKRGDLLVTSSIPGVAMKADIEKVKPGQVIGKALENFNSSSTGKIKVLVSVK